jgi:hypothetical protein
MGNQFGSADKTGHSSAQSRADTRHAPQRKLLALLILLAFPATQPQHVFAEASQDTPLPDLGQRPASTSVIRPSGNRVTLENSSDGKKFLLAPEYSNQNGLGIAAALASLVGDNAAVGILLNVGADKKELLVNAGYQPDAGNRFILSVGQLRQFFDIAFPSGAEKAEMTQTSGGLSYQFYLGRELLNYLELNGYLADTPSRSLGDKTFSVDTATLYELWNDQRRIAGGRVTGLQGKLGLTPLPGGTVKLGFGSERLTYDYLTGSQSVDRLTGGAEWQQKLGNGFAFNLGGDSAAAASRYTLGLTHSAPTEGGGNSQLGIGLIAIRGRDGMRDDNQVKLSYTATFDGARKTAAAHPASGNAMNAPAWGSMLDQVALRPLYLPMQAIAKLDPTAIPVRLIAVDKTALPSGTTLDRATGNVSAALPRPASGIAGVTRNGAAFANIGQFALVGGGLVVSPRLIEQPAVGIKDTYVVTLNNSGGGTTLVTVVISHGSVKIDSISVADGDITPPVISGLAVGSITPLGASLSATLNEAGNGYYVLLPAGAATPSATQVKNGQDAAGASAASKGSAAMTANAPASFALAGLTAVTAYKVCFAAIDSVNNLQPAVSVASFTTAAAVTTPNAFDIVDMIGQHVATAITTNTITVSGINIPVSAATSVGTLVKNGVNTNAASASVVNGDTLAVRLTTAATLTSPPVTGTLTIGTLADGFSISTAVPDTIPDAFSFTAQSGVALSTKVESNAITVSGINTASPLSVSGGEYQVNGGAWSSAAGTVGNGNMVKVRLTSAAGNSATTQATLTIGGVTGVFSSTTLAAAPPADTTPDAFTFVDQTGVALSTVITSAAITVEGINAPSPISISGVTAQYSINGGAWSSAVGTVTNGQTVQVRITSSGSNSTAVAAVLNIGGVTDSFDVTTLVAPDTTPAAFDIINMTNQALSTAVTTNAITVAGINQSVTASTTVGLIVKNGVDTGLSSVTVSNGDTVAIKLTTSGSNSTTINGTLTIGTGATSTDNFSVTTVAAVNAAPTITNLPNWGAGVTSASSTPQTVTFGDDKVWGGASSIAITVDKGSISGLVGGSYGAKNFTYDAPVVGAPDSANITYTVTDSDGVMTQTTQNILLNP